LFPALAGLLVSAVAAAPDALAEPKYGRYNRESRAVGGFLGARLLSDSRSLGVVGGSKVTIASSVSLGGRATIWARGWLLVEAELPLMFTSAQGTAARPTVLVIEPRVHGRFRLPGLPGLPGLRDITPMAIAGAGATVSLSGNTDVIRNDLEPSFYAGVGATWLRRGSFGVRADVRLLVVPARTGAVTGEAEFSLGIFHVFGGADKPQRQTWSTAAERRDRDGDRLPIT
jgi:hypothetical protein